MENDCTHVRIDGSLREYGDQLVEHALGQRVDRRALQRNLGHMVANLVLDIRHVSELHYAMLASVSRAATTLVSPQPTRLRIDAAVLLYRKSYFPCRL